MSIGSLFSGYGGLDLAVESVFGATPAWFCEFEPAPSKVLAVHWPSVPNLGDITTVDWPAVEPVDIITGGSPCQDLSHAGRRAGMTDGTRSNLWVQMREAIAVLRPSMVIWENVRGALSADADSAVEPCAGCVGDEPTGNLRALGRVLGDLAELGYDAQWHGLRAADVGAPHGRFRVFVVAQHAHGGGCGPTRVAGMGRSMGGGRDDPRDAATPADASLVSTTDAEDIGHERGRESRRRRTGSSDGGSTAADARGERLWEHAGKPSAEEAGANGGDLANGHGGLRPDTDWGPYRPAIRRWEHVIGRPAPAPTEPGTRGGQRLSPRFVEWMMGLPAGWVTDVPGISRNDQLKMLGNGVVPQQAAVAIRHMTVLERAA